MASTTFINNQTVIYAEWLNDVNSWTYNGTSISGIINGTTLALQTGGLDALNIDASQKVTVGTLEVSGVAKVDNGLTFSDSTVQTHAAYCVADGTMYENNLTVNNNYTITSGRSASSVGPITIASGKSVTVPNGSRWVIL